jgi:hypothetical protein
LLSRARLNAAFDPVNAVRLLLYAVGAAGGFSWIFSVDDLFIVPTVVLGTLAHAAAGLRGGGRGRRMLAAAGRVVDVAYHLHFAFVAVTLGLMLHWAVPAWAKVALGLPALAWLAERVTRRRGRVPLALPVGLWVLACLIGWQLQDGAVRCDDYLRFRQEGVLEFVLPSHPALAACRAGDEVRVPRYPRNLWEYPDGRRLLVTTQRGVRNADQARNDPASRLDGSVCEVSLDGVAETRCLGEGKAQGIVASEARRRVYVAEWALGRSGKEGAVMAFPFDGPLRVVDRVALSRASGELYYEPSADVLGVFFDDLNGQMKMLDAGDLQLFRGDFEAAFLPGDIPYDPATGEGLLCFAPNLISPIEDRAAVAVAFRGFPFVARPLVSSARYPWAWLALVWGCELDAAGRKAYIGVANLGLLLTVDYDAGGILAADFLGFGLRKTVLDASRRRLYIADFLRGDVITWDLERGVEVDRRFAGRFLRGMRLSRDGRTLWLASSLGVLRMPLEGGAGR